MDATHISVKRRTVSKKAAYIVMGIRLDGINKVLGFTKQLKKYTKRKEHVPNKESLEKFLISQFNQYNQKFLGQGHKGFKEIQHTLESIF